ncbi:DUF5983 family protein [Serratia marcescens]|uniref:DUF5983 family protein n=1 Tax=Serratia marcescens TaxID=615 RepID=UPI0032046586
MQTEKLLVCSTAHFTHEDNQLLATMAGEVFFSFWVANMQYGYIIVMTEYRWKLLVLKSHGASRALRRFLIQQIKYQKIRYFHFDRDAPIDPFHKVFDW